MTSRFAWPQYRREWDLDVSVANAALANSGVERDADARRIRLDLERSWDTLDLRFEATSSERPPNDLGPVEAHVLLSSSRTNIRQPFRLEPVESGFAGVATLHRSQLAGAVDLQATVTTVDPIRVVGTSAQWTIVIDSTDAPAPPGAPPFVTQWSNFGADDAPDIARAASGSYAVMDFSAKDPVLHLNTQIRGFEALMHSTKAQLERRRLRDTLGTTIARYALNAMVREAVSRITIDDDGVIPPDSGLFRQVLDSVADSMSALESYDDFCRKLVVPQDMTPPERARFWADLDAAVDRLTGHSEMVAAVVEEIRND